MSSAANAELFIALLNGDDEALEKTEAGKRLRDLCNEYKIKWSGPEKYFVLALRLAEKYEPEPKKMGRPTKWVLSVSGILVVEVERIICGPKKKSEAAAFRELAKRELWKNFLSDNPYQDENHADALKQAYTRAIRAEWEASAEDKKKATKNTQDSAEPVRLYYLERDIFESYEKSNEIEKWDQAIEQYVVRKSGWDD